MSKDSTRKSGPAAANDTKPEIGKLDVQRIRVGADGHDRGGTYWGAGDDVFIVRSRDGTEEVTLRAKSVTDARKAAAEQLAHGPGGALRRPTPRIGGHPTRKTRHEFKWRNAITGETVRLRVTHARDYLTSGTDHIEIESIAPKRAPLPITASGYRSHFLRADELAQLGGLEHFVAGWLEGAAATKDWQRSQAPAAQGDLFAWAKAQREVAEKHQRRPSAPAPKRRTAARKDRAPE